MMLSTSLGSRFWCLTGCVLFMAGLITVSLSCSGDKEEEIEVLEPREEPIPVSGRPLPPIEVEIDPEVILRINPPPALTDEPPLEPRPQEQDARTDEEVIDSVTHRWVYVAFQNIGGEKRGTFRYNDQAKIQFSLPEGERREGIRVASLDESKAICVYGTARRLLPLIRDYALDPQVKKNPGKLLWDSSPEGKEMAMQRYREIWGKRFEYENREHTPAPGEVIPPNEMPTEEETKESVDRLLDMIMELRKAGRNEGDPVSITREELRKIYYRQMNIGTDDVQEATNPGEEGTLLILRPGSGRD